MQLTGRNYAASNYKSLMHFKFEWTNLQEDRSVGFVEDFCGFAGSAAPQGLHERGFHVHRPTHLIFKGQLWKERDELIKQISPMRRA
jgi:hypothetical protein